eukprot:SAG25_NODE_2284_length_1753_cov_4.197624_2_plen_27_part_01
MQFAEDNVVVLMVILELPAISSMHGSR